MQGLLFGKRIGNPKQDAARFQKQLEDGVFVDFSNKLSVNISRSQLFAGAHPDEFLIETPEFKAILNTKADFHSLTKPALEYASGAAHWFVQGKRHRTDGPAIESDQGKQWWIDGQLHRVGAPAKDFVSGVEEWWLFGKRHREDGPALIDALGYEWWKHGLLHRVGGPAAISNGLERWYQNGKLHREGGPAVVDSNGSEEWWLNGSQHDPRSI